MPLDPDVKDYLLAEFADRRAQFNRHIDQVVHDQRYAIIATGAFWAWIATHRIESSFAFTVWLPTGLLAFFLVKWLVLRVTVERIVRYVTEVESVFSLPTGLGWSGNYTKYGQDLLGPFSTIFWLVLLALNAFLAIALPLVPVAFEAK